MLDQYEALNESLNEISGSLTKRQRYEVEAFIGNRLEKDVINNSKSDLVAKLGMCKLTNYVYKCSFHAKCDKQH